MANSKMSLLIEQYLQSDDFGNGHVSVVAYSTGWVARLNKSVASGEEPLFPECLQFLRNNQLKDGSWGSDHPFLIFDRIIATLSSINCLKKWNYEQDSQLISSGFEYLNKNLDGLKGFKKRRDQFTVGFILLAYPLIKEAQDFGFKFSCDSIIEELRTEYKKRTNILTTIDEEPGEISSLKSWHFSLEGIDSLFTKQRIKQMETKTGLICGNFEATAYALMKGVELSPKSLQHLKKIVAANGGGVPSLYKVVISDLAWSLNALINCGFPLESEYVKPHIDRLEGIWREQKGMVGSSIALPPDADDIAISWLVLNKAGRLTFEEGFKNVVKFFNGQYFVTYENEKRPTLSANIHLMIVLQHFKQPEALQLAADVYQWTKSYIIETNYGFQDKWHFSRLYAMPRALMAFKYYDIEFSEKILQMILDDQNGDGGWGTQGVSSKTETSYVVIALIDWVKFREKHQIQFVLNALIRTNTFLREGKGVDNVNLWLSKSLYSIRNFDKFVVLCAKYALDHYFSSN